MELHLQGDTMYKYDLGMPIQKFKKYPDDERLKLYRNLGNSKREGMFLYGYLEKHHIDALALMEEAVVDADIMHIATVEGKIGMRLPAAAY